MGLPAKTDNQRLMDCEALLVELHAQRAGVYRTLTQGLPQLFKGDVDTLETALRGFSRRIREAEKRKLRILERLAMRGGS